VHTQALEIFTENNLVLKFQSGFRGMHSTCTALIFATDLWLGNMDEGLLTGNVFIDLKKAFDNWFESYLKDRRQQCYVNGVLSDEEYITYGVPQRSILGPLLFLIYVNDFPNCLQHSTPGMFVDDTYDYSNTWF